MRLELLLGVLDAGWAEGGHLIGIHAALDYAVEHREVLLERDEVFETLLGVGDDRVRLQDLVFHRIRRDGLIAALDAAANRVEGRGVLGKGVGEGLQCLLVVGAG